MRNESVPTSNVGPRVFPSPDELLDAVGESLGTSEWILIDQERIDTFAEATGDDQWIHVDPVKSAAGPFGATIAHGYLTLSLTNRFMPEIMRVDGASMGINYGVNKVRFPQPVVVGSLVRGTATVQSCERIAGGVQVVVEMVVEVEGSDRPACVCHAVSRFMN